MGLYPIECPGCKKNFMWFSGNAGDQRCDDCRAVDASKDNYIMTPQEAVLKACEFKAKHDTNLTAYTVDRIIEAENSRLIPFIKALLEQNERLVGTLERASDVIDFCYMNAPRNKHQIEIADCLTLNTAALEKLAKGEK